MSGYPRRKLTPKGNIYIIEEREVLLPSSMPVVENAQHEPQEPWFLTGVTAPLGLQSQLRGSLKIGQMNREL